MRFPRSGLAEHQRADKYNRGGGPQENIGCICIL